MDEEKYAAAMFSIWAIILIFIAGLVIGSVLTFINTPLPDITGMVMQMEGL